MNSVSDIEETYSIDFSGHEMYTQLIIDVFNGNFNEEELEKTNDSNISNIIGLYYYYVRKDLETAENFYLLSINLGNFNAIFNMGNLKQAQKKYDEMKYFYTLGVEHGNKRCLISLSIYYTNVEINEDKALEFHKMGEELNIPFHVDFMANYHYKLGNVEKAIELLLKNVELRYVKSLISLSNIYVKRGEIKKGLDVLDLKIDNLLCLRQKGIYLFNDGDYENAKNCFFLAAERKDSISVEYLCIIYEKEKNYECLNYWLEMGAELNNLYCIRSLSIKYNTIELDFDRMKFYLDKGIELNDDFCINYLGSYYLKYINCNGNAKKAKELFEKGLKNDSTTSIHNLGIYYKLTNDNIRMVHYLTISTNRGFLSSLDMLIEYYRLIGDNENFLACLMKGVELNYTKCIYLASLAYEYNDEEKMIYYLKMGVNLNDSDSILKLAQVYRRKDEEKFIAFCDEQLINGHKEIVVIYSTFYRAKMDYENMKRILYMDIDNPCIKNILGSFYIENENNKQKGIDLLIESALLENTQSIFLLTNFLNMYEFYYTLNNLENKSNVITTTLECLKKYFAKFEENLANYHNSLEIKECNTCLEEKKIMENIKCLCKGTLCLECFVKNNGKCIYCR